MAERARECGRERGDGGWQRATKEINLDKYPTIKRRMPEMGTEWKRANFNIIYFRFICEESSAGKGLYADYYYESFRVIRLHKLVHIDFCFRIEIIGELV